MDGWYVGQRVLTLSPAVVGPPHHSPGWRARQKLVGQVEDVHQKLSDSDFHLLSVPELQFCFRIRFQNNIEAAKTDGGLGLQDVFGTFAKFQKTMYEETIL